MHFYQPARGRLGKMTIHLPGALRALLEIDGLEGTSVRSDLLFSLLVCVCVCVTKQSMSFLTQWSDHSVLSPLLMWRLEKEIKNTISHTCRGVYSFPTCAHKHVSQLLPSLFFGNFLPAPIHPFNSFCPNRIVDLFFLPFFFLLFSLLLT